ncbi:MAG: LOG family protein [Caulobacteraceae bacterium]
MTAAPSPIRSPIHSIGVFCGSASGVNPAHAEAAEAFGRALAEAGIELVYGGGGVGLMGLCARAALAGGGRVVGVIPEFLMRPELALEAAELVVVPSMHARKAEMFERADAFCVLPGGVGTLEEAVELLSWGRLNLHRKPVVFLNTGRFWEPFFALVRHTVSEGFTPAEFEGLYRPVEGVDEVIPTLRAMMGEGSRSAPISLL